MQTTFIILIQVFWNKPLMKLLHYMGKETFGLPYVTVTAWIMGWLMAFTLFIIYLIMGDEYTQVQRQAYPLGRRLVQGCRDGPLEARAIQEESRGAGRHVIFLAVSHAVRA